MTTDQIKQIRDKGDKILSVRFEYNGKRRELDNITIEDFSQSICLTGYQMRKSGQFNYQVRRFDVDKINELEFIDPPTRSGPVIGRD